MICPFRTDTVIKITDDFVQGKEIIRQEVYPQCEGNRCPYYRCTLDKSKLFYDRKKEKCKLADKQIRG